MFVQNFIELSAALHELSYIQRKNNSDENITVRRYRADSRRNKTTKKKLQSWYWRACECIYSRSVGYALRAFAMRELSLSEVAETWTIQLAQAVGLIRRIYAAFCAAVLIGRNAGLAVRPSVRLLCTVVLTWEQEGAQKKNKFVQTFPRQESPECVFSVQKVKYYG